MNDPVGLQTGRQTAGTDKEVAGGLGSTRSRSLVLSRPLSVSVFVFVSLSVSVSVSMFVSVSLSFALPVAVLVPVSVAVFVCFSASAFVPTRERKRKGHSRIQSPEFQKLPCRKQWSIATGRSSHGHRSQLQTSGPRQSCPLRLPCIEETKLAAHTRMFTTRMPFIRRTSWRNYSLKGVPMLVVMTFE